MNGRKIGIHGKRGWGTPGVSGDPQCHTRGTLTLVYQLFFHFFEFTLLFKFRPVYNPGPAILVVVGLRCVLSGRGQVVVVII